MGVQREVEVGLGRRMRRELQVEPLILCLVQPAPAGTPAYKSKAMEEKDDRPAPRRGGRHGGPNGSGGGRRDAAPAPVPARSAAPAKAAVAEKVEPKAAAAAAAPAPEPEMPAGRTRRRRSAAV